MKKIRSLLIILTIIMCIVAMTACTGDSKPTESPLLSMDKVDRAILLYERHETMSISSYKISQETSFVVEDSSNKTDINSTAQTTAYDLLGQNFAEYTVGEIDAEGTKIKIEQGFVNGKEFYITSDGVKMYAPITKEEYLNKRENTAKKLEENLRINNENCGTIDSYQNSEGDWVITAKDYSVSASRAIFESVFEDIAATYGYTVSQCSVEVTILLKEDGTPCRTRITITTTPYEEYDLKLTLTDVSVYTDVNSVKVAPKIDLSGAFEVPSVDLFDDISESINETANAENGKINIDAKVIISGDLDYSYHEQNNITYSNTNGVYKMYDDIEIEEEQNRGRPQNRAGYFSYDGTTLIYSLSGETQQSSMDSEAVKALVFGFYKGVIPTEQDVTSYSLKKGNGYDALWFDASQIVYDKAEQALETLTGINWSVYSAEGTYLVRVDESGNVIYIKMTVSLSASYLTYRITFDVVNTIEFTK